MSGDGKGQSPGNGEISPEDREAIRKRSEELGHKLDALKTQRAKAERSVKNGSQSGDFGAAFKFAAELVVGVVVGGALGWALDQHLGTAPWLMIVLVIMGFAAGLLNVVRAAQQAQAKNEPLQRAAPSVKDDDE
ncbi:MAG: AtpZ/AtpI family protein [Hyphomicrobium denitrificans]|uniref:FoF1 ATP synthase, subunit I n=1 Tax=Hyphomicrobium denitrificans (strain ATCC 51888 / DSM 1869 / NCIMB 11706 / TK 0415) TaxID=582899 RepID=D8JUQ1_HYPDA|nr:AtpZ/AtpI family protein [Hyphomicrobium denitrificans]ADJ24681.1 FoF1 ATP synthase, subunit I [Hyphomicrobium denitrificans ATCC 51888]MBN9280953.1 AtpZ/AtpI family protein [Hyphomicrobium denitrificans]